MSERYGFTEDPHGHLRYEIRLKGHLDTRWAYWFEGMRFSYGSDGTTILTGRIVDQAELFGMLRKVRDLGLHLVSIIQVDPLHEQSQDVSTDAKLDQDESKKKESNL